MESNIIRVVHTIPMGAGGISNLTMTINEKIDRDRFEFDYLVFRNQKEFCDERAARLGSPKLIVDVSQIRNPIKKGICKILWTSKLLKGEGIKILHIDASTPYDVVLAVAGKIARVPTIIFHAHSDNYERKISLRNSMMWLFRILIPVCVTDYIAISEKAAEFLFPHNVYVSRNYQLIKNGIDVNRFVFNQVIRDKYRTENSWNNKFVVGHVGRFVYAKNHEFLIDIFEEIVRINDDSILLLIGVGELENEIRNKVALLNLQDKVVFWGVTEDVANLMQAMDVFVFPSRYEGLGMAAIESQAAGLPTICTDVLPKEIEISECLQKMSLQAEPKKWAEMAISLYDKIPRINRAEEIRNSGYDINQIVEHLEGFYSASIMNHL